MNADIILILDQGRVVQKGTHEELVCQDGIYRQIFDIQTRIETELEHEISRTELTDASEIIEKEPFLVS
jgi:ABC-type enterochelin transport system ATPase subunit